MLAHKRLVFMTMHKSASMMLWRWLSHIATRTGIPHHSENSANFPNHWMLEQDPSQIAKHTGIFGPFRTFINVDGLPETEIVLQLRDPRDLMVSLYYSFCNSHPAPDGIDLTKDREHWRSIGIDEFVLNDPVEWGPLEFRRDFGSDAMLERYLTYCHRLIGRPNVTLLKYEDMFDNFEHWWSGFITPFGTSLEPAFLDELKASMAADLKPPPAEDITAHKRKMLPGDYREKLKPETIEALNRKFDSALRTMGYL